MAVQDDVGGFLNKDSPISPEITSHVPLNKEQKRLTEAQESVLIDQLDAQMTTISSRFTRRGQQGGYTNLKRLSKDYHDLLRSISPAPPSMKVQCLLRLLSDLNVYIPELPFPPDNDPRGLLFILREIDVAISNLLKSEKGLRQTERVRLRGELERGRGVVSKKFESYRGEYEVLMEISRVYEKSLEGIDETGDVGVIVREDTLRDSDFEIDLEARVMDADGFESDHSKV